MTTSALMKEYMDYRCGIYYILKNLYITEPSRVMLEEISSMSKNFTQIEELPTYEKDFLSFFMALNTDEILALHHDVKVEYARLFIGPKRVPIPAYESVYRENRKRMFGRTTVRVRELYEHAGLKLNVKKNLPEDFIGFELEFMYYLIYQTIEAIEANNMQLVEKLLTYQHHFLHNHLTQWIEKLTTDIEEETNLIYFKVLARFTNEFIMSDYQNLSEMI